MSVSNKQITIKMKSIGEKKNKQTKPVSCHTYLILFTTIFNAILFKKPT